LNDLFLLTIAGPNGAGKTTLTRRLLESGVDFGIYINPDDIAHELSGSYQARVAQAQAIADKRRDACIEAKRSFSFETVMSHPSKVELLVRAKAAGFFVQLFFVGTDDPRTNIDRVALRVALGGHDVPRDRIVARWHRTMALLHRAMAISDRSFIFDNSASGPDIAGPRLVLEANVANGVVTLRERGPVPDWVRRFAIVPLAT
jgi:predicted ABC-type ATPase